MKGTPMTRSESMTQTYDAVKIRYYWRGVRVPWIVWAMFHGKTEIVGSERDVR